METASARTELYTAQPDLSALDASPIRNRILGALAASELAAIKPHLEPVYLRASTRLFGQGQSITDVYFPETAIIRVVNPVQERRAIEIGTIGREGMVGLSVFLDGESPLSGVTQVPGIARRMDAQTFRRLAGRPGSFQRVVLRYTHALLTHVAQTATCFRKHSIGQRCACWLLMAQERVDAPGFPITHRSLSQLLGVRRSSVTQAMRSLKDRKLVEYVRGRVQIVDAAGLEQAACECYGIATTQYGRLGDSAEWPDELRREHDR